MVITLTGNLRLFLDIKGYANKSCFRPVDQFMTATVAFTDDGKLTIKVLDDSFDFGETLDTDTVSSWTSNAAAKFVMPS